ncbi:hypothetical protein GCM10009678_49790 [Actinomadura kijaniata]|uniref:hypothetical protein n=1 Tax=Actinomadura kijaniata TaxID=46161 RepID=UPI002FEDAD69
MRRVLAGVTAGVLGLAAGCSGGDEDPGTDGNVAGEPAVTAEESARVLADWTRRYNEAVGSGDARVWREAVTGPLAAPVEARVRTYGRLPGSARVEPRNPVFYVPRQKGWPRWFAVAALDGGRQVLAVFARAGAKDRWRAAHWLPFKGRPPELAYDSEGYAVPAPDRGVAAAHAAYLGGDDTAPLTPDAFSSDARARRDRFAPGPGPSYALQTKDGGSLVWYGLTQEQAGGGTPRAELRDYLTRTGRTGGGVRATWQWLAIGYAPVSGRANVLGESVSLAAVR